MADQVRISLRMAYIAPILRELQIVKCYSNTYAYHESILNMLPARGNRWRCTELIEKTSGANRTFARVFRSKSALVSRRDKWPTTRKPVFLVGYWCHPQRG